MLKSHTKEALLLVRKPPPRCEEVSGRDKGSVHILHTANRRSGAIPRVFKYRRPPITPSGGWMCGYGPTTDNDNRILVKNVVRPVGGHNVSP